jgi:TonB-dependent starch-binding outer membrane protein SusC
MNAQRKISLFSRLLLGFLTLFFAAGSLSAQQRVSGKVTGSDGEALIGASVAVKGTSLGTVTDIDGNYDISVKNGESVLNFSYTGYTAKSEIVGNRTKIDVSMTSGVDLNQVIVVGYGSQKKADLTGAVSSVSAKDIGDRPITSLDQALGGRATGVQISNRSGDPGAPIEVRIRGVGTTGNNKPLWVIDGVAIELTSNATVNTASYSESNPLAGINPSDIESINVLKDASASAIYGSRAANGVILVTTKRGKEGRTVATYDGYYGISTVPKSRQLSLLGVSDYIALQKDLGRDLSAFNGKPAYDWQDALFQSAAVKSNNLSISGGTKTLTFNVGGGVHDQGGVELGQNFKRVSMHANSEVKVGDYLKFGESMMVSSVNHLVQSEGGNFAAIGGARNAPYYQGLDATDPTGYNPTGDAIVGSGATSANYLWLTDPKYNQTRVVNRKALGSVFGEFEPIAGLKFRMLYGVDYNVSNGFFFQETSVKNYGGGGDRKSLLVQERPIELNTNWTNTATYSKTYGKHDMSIMGGYEEVSFRYDKVRLQGNSLFNSNIQFASVASAVSGANEADQSALRSLFGRLNYTFNDKYLIQANIRRDQSSRFAKENRTAVFPSFSAGWRVSEESFFAGMKENGIDFLKLRGSWGQLGNQYVSGSSLAYISSLSILPFYALGNRPVRAPAPIVFANRALKWETSTQIDLGFDAGLFNNHVDVVFDYFDKKSKDVLLALPIPLTTGYFLPADANIGSIGNKGVELGISYNNRAGDFRYSIGGNFTTLKNKVLDLGTIPEIITGVGGAQTHRTSVGQPLGYFYGYKTNGIYKDDTEAAAALPDAEGHASAGDIRFVDVNGDGKISSLDKTNIGSSIPQFFYGGDLSANYKGLDFSIFVQGTRKVKVFNQARQGLEGLSGGNNQLASTLDRWTEDNHNGKLPRASESDPNNNRRYSDRWIENAAYLRIKNIQLGYTIPSAKMSSSTKSLVSGARVFIAVQNIATFTKYKGYDPEVTRGNSFQKGEFSLANGQDSGGSPQPTITQFGLQVTF